MYVCLSYVRVCVCVCVCVYIGQHPDQVEDIRERHHPDDGEALRLGQRLTVHWRQVCWSTEPEATHREMSSPPPPPPHPCQGVKLQTGDRIQM